MITITNAPKCHYIFKQQRRICLVDTIIQCIWIINHSWRTHTAHSLPPVTSNSFTNWWQVNCSNCCNFSSDELYVNHTLAKWRHDKHANQTTNFTVCPICSIYRNVETYAFVCLTILWHKPINQSLSKPISHLNTMTLLRVSITETDRRSSLVTHWHKLHLFPSATRELRCWYILEGQS